MKKMVIRHSVLQYLNGESDEEVNAISSQNSYSSGNGSTLQWQSVLQCMNSESDEEQNAISSLNSYSSGKKLAYPRQWQNENKSTHQWYLNGESDEEENAISSPNSYRSGEKFGYARQWQNGNESTYQWYLNDESDEEENAISSLNSCSSDEKFGYTGQWQNENESTHQWYLNGESDEEENAISSLNSYSSDEKLSYARQWQNGNESIHQWYLNGESDEEEKAISSLNSYNRGEKLSYARQWQNGNESIHQRYLNGESDEEENAISSLNSYTRGEKFGYARQWQNGNESTHQWYLNSESDEEENASSSLNSYSSGERLGYARQWQNGNGSTLSRQMKYLTISVPDLKASPSLAHTSMNTTIKSSSAVSTKQITPQNGEERRREEGTRPLINCTVVVPEGRRIKHYSSCHRILLVGEGDFSFSTCLATAFGRASNMIATSLDSEDFLVRNYKNALSNLAELSNRKCKVMHEIDATKMANHPSLAKTKFDRIIFNFPFAGFFKDTPRDSQLRRHRSLVNQFLMNAKEMVSENGEIHISHKTNGFHMEWRIESIASLHKLRLVEAVDFNLLDYPGYNTKCGFGGDNNFNCYPSMTFKFGL